LVATAENLSEKPQVYGKLFQSAQIVGFNPCNNFCLNILSHTMSGHVRMAHVAGFSPSLSEE
jgi:hypothetical protein